MLMPGAASRRSSRNHLPQLRVDESREMGNIVGRYRHRITRADRHKSLGGQDAVPIQRIRARRWQPGTSRRSPEFGRPHHDVGCDRCVIERGLDLV